jgi:hypothetical protein
MVNGIKMKAKLIKRDDNFYSLKLDGIVMATSNGMLVDYNLSKQNCDEIFSSLVVDVEKLAKKLSPNSSWEKGYVAGFNKAMELNNKVFTLEEVHKLLRLVHILPNFELEQFEDENNVLQIDTFISHHIQQPTEIEVEIEMDILNEYEQPKLDSSGCLILKRVV